ncbi:Uncharacterised protein [uncultured Ruminococcus sp.]|nr:Uncharacterised protein [uncultured Ruminococcus sp.]
MTEVIYLEVSEKTEAAKKAGRRVSVSGMLKFLGVSRSGYLAWLHHVPSDTEKRRKAVKAKIQDIYDDSKQNYGAPKITLELQKLVKSFRKEPLVHICAKWESVLGGANHGRSPQKIPISALNYKISLMSNLILIVRMQFGVRILPTSG